MAKDRLSYQEMAALESKGYAKNPVASSPDRLSYEDMKSMESQGLAKSPGMDVVDTAGAAQAGLESFGNAATLGYLPQMQAAVGKLMPNPSRGVDADLEAKGFKISQPEQGYTELRDENLIRQAQQKKDFPKASLAGTVAGIGATALVPVGTVAKGASFGAKVAQGAKIGGVMGAVANPGDTVGEISPVQIEKRFINAVLGAGIGAAATGAIEGVSAGVKKGAEWLRGKAAEKAVGALKPTAKIAQTMKATGRDQDIGRTLLDEGAIPILGTPKRIGARIDGLKEAAGEKVGELVRSGGAEKVVDATELAVNLLESPRVAQLRKTPGMESVANRVDQLADTLANNGQMTLEQTQALRQAIDKSINFSRQVPEMKGIMPVLYDLRTSLRDRMNQVINERGGQGTDALLKANRAYSNLAEASTLAGKAAAKDLSNRSISLTDTIAAGAGLASGGPLVSAAAGALNKGVRTFGASLAARSSDAAAKLLEKSMPMSAFARANPVAFQAASQRMFGLTGKLEKGSDPVLDNPEIMLLFEQDPRLIDNVSNPKLREEIRGRVQKNRSPAERRLGR